MIKNYQKREHTTVKALEWTGSNDEEINQFVPKHIRLYENDGLYILSREGNILVPPGDMIIERKGEFRTVPKDVFLNTYEEVTLEDKAKES